MDYKIFFSTFILIFLAELGDKTQLTALAFSSTSKSVWPVFLGASVALVFSTMLACLLGSFLKSQSLVSMSLIKGISGVLFIVFGVIILFDLINPPKPTQEKYSDIITGIPDNLISRVVLTAAKNLEEESIKHYEEAVALIGNEKVRGIIKQIIAEERKHISAFYDHELYGKVKEEIIYPQVKICKSDNSCKATQIILGMVLHEKEAALFYKVLAKEIGFKSVKALLNKIALEEEQHVIILEKLLAENENLQ